MSDRFYGTQSPREQLEEIDAHLEALSIVGFSVMTGVIPDTDLPDWRERIDAAYATQLSEFGSKVLESIGELDLCRAPLLQDREFVKLAMTRKVLDVVRRILGNWFILNVQNAIINRPDRSHYQSAWHRDLPHQNWVISRPLAIGALFVIDKFNVATGATMFLPTSHRHETIPSQTWISNNSLTVEAKPGSVILFDAMIFHRAGTNTSDSTRRAVNHLYSVPILKQQYDFPRSLGDQAFTDPETMQVLGYNSQVALDASEWRRERLKRIDKRK